MRNLFASTVALISAFALTVPAHAQQFRYGPPPHRDNRFAEGVAVGALVGVGAAIALDGRRGYVPAPPMQCRDMFLGTDFSGQAHFRHECRPMQMVQHCTVDWVDQFGHPHGVCTVTSTPW